MILYMGGYPFHLFAIPFISAFIGWLTNYLAVKMLFRPYEPIRLFFITIQGIFPKRRDALTEKLALIIAEDLLHKEKLLGQISENSRLDDLITDHVKEYIGELITHKIKKIPLVSTFLGEGMIQSLEESLLRDFKAGLGPVKERFLHEAISGLDIKKAVSDYLEGLSMKEMETLIRSVLKKEFKFIEWSGAGLGFLIGMGQWAIIYWGGA